MIKKNRFGEYEPRTRQESYMAHWASMAPDMIEIINKLPELWGYQLEAARNALEDKIQGFDLGFRLGFPEKFLP
ncbi:MAG: hypothetical protein GXY24_03670 [Bacteroidales bacterium]|nr:hypothetical protein [Bacteroidales bacterium]